MGMIIMIEKAGDYRPYLAGLTFSLVFGFSFLFSKEALEVITPFHLLGFRFIVAAASITLIRELGFIETDFKNKPLKPLIIISIFQPVLYFTFEIMGINFTTSSQAGLMISLLPVAVAVLAVFFLGEVPGKLQAVCILLSVAGVGLVVASQGELGASTHYLGIILLLGAVLSGGAYNIISRLISNEYTPVEITFFMCYTGAIIFNVIGFYLFPGGIMDYLGYVTHPQIIASMLYLGALSSVLAFFMLNYALARLPASQAAVFANLTTVVSIFAGVLIRGEPFLRQQALGAILIIIGVWGTNYFDMKEEGPSASSTTSLQKE